MVEDHEGVSPHTLVLAGDDLETLGHGRTVVVTTGVYDSAAGDTRCSEGATDDADGRIKLDQPSTTKSIPGKVRGANRVFQMAQYQRKSSRCWRLLPTSAVCA